MMLFCENCKELISEFDVIAGETRDVDDYDNQTCCNCGSDELIEVDESDICVECGAYMQNEDEYGDRFCECSKTSEFTKLHPIFADMANIMYGINKGG